MMPLATADIEAGGSRGPIHAFSIEEREDIMMMRRWALRGGGRSRGRWAAASRPSPGSFAATPAGPAPRASSTAPPRLRAEGRAHVLQDLRPPLGEYRRRHAVARRRLRQRFAAVEGLPHALGLGLRRVRLVGLPLLQHALSPPSHSVTGDGRGFLRRALSCPEIASHNSKVLHLL